MIEFIKPFLPEILTGVLGLGAWANERNKRKQDVKRAETQNIQAVLDLYQDAIMDLRKNYDATIQEMKMNNAAKFSQLEEDIKKLRENVNLWKTKYTKLKKDFDDYRSKHN